MKKEWKDKMKTTVQRATVAALVLAAGGAATLSGGRKQESRQPGTQEVKGKFFCNIKALTAEERARHHALTLKLIGSRTATVETAKGYELQFKPEIVSVAEVAQWVTTESKCCPFFDFHIDLEEEGKLVCLRLTGSEGIKAFIRSEFHI